MSRGFESHALRALPEYPGARTSPTWRTDPVNTLERTLHDARPHPGGTMARHGRLRATTGAGSLFKGIAMLLGVLIISTVVFGGIVWWNLQSGVQTFEITDEAPAENLAAYEGGVNLLLVGSDSRVGQGAEFGEGQDDASGTLNDVNMILHLSADHSHATVVSIPRDTVVDTPACRNDQGDSISEQYAVPFNSILDTGGMNCIIATAEAMSGLNIQFAAMIQFRGVIEMSNAVGGVEVCVESPIEDSYVGLSLDAGMHSLQGAEALKFLRTRHGVGDGSDLSRISNQQVFLSALMRTVKSNDTLSNPAKLYGLARAATQNMTLSSNLNNLDTLVSLATALAQVPLDQFAFVRLPVADSVYYEGKVDPTPDAEFLWERLRADQPINVAPDASVTDGAIPSDAPEPSPSEEATEAPTEGTDGATDTVAPTVPPTLDGQTANDQTCSNAGSVF